MAAPAYVRNTSVQNAGNGGDVAFTISPSATVGDLLLVAYDSSAAQLNFPSDFAHLGTFSGTGTNDVWYKYLQAGDAGRTVDFGSSVSLFQFILIECSGAAGPPTLTTHAVTNGGASGNVAVSGPTTSAADPWLPIVLWASFDGTGSLNASITSLSGVTLIANLSPGAGYPNALAAGYQAGQAAGATNPASSAACDTGSTQTSVAALIAVHSATAPSAATLATPPNASYLDATVGATFQANFNSTSGANANAYALRIKSGGAYSYWNAGTSSWQSTIVWNACSVAPGAQLAVGPITAGLANGTTYNWSMAFQEATASLQGPFASDFTFSAQSAPTLVVNAPTGTVTTTNEPVVSWTTTPGGTAAQTSYRVVVYPSSVYTAGGFAAGQASGAVWDSGVVASASQSVVMGAPLPTNNTTYRAYVQVTETGGETSAWQFSGFTLSLDTPATPTITATAGTDPATGCPRIALAIQGHDNLLTADDASVEGSVGTHAARTNCSVAQSTAQAQDGTHSLALTSTAAGAMSESTATGTSGYPVTPGLTYSWMSSYRAAGLTYDQLVSASSPSAWWKLTDAVASSTAADSSGNSHTGTVNPTVTFGQTGPVVYTAETGAKAPSGNIAASSIDGDLPAHAISVEMWWKWDPAQIGTFSNGALAPLYSLNNNGLGVGIMYRLGFGGSDYVYYVMGAASWLPSSTVTVPVDSNWHHLVVVYTSTTTASIYADGVLLGSLAFTAMTNQTGALFLFAQNGSHAWDGYLAQVATYPIALSSATVAAHYNAGLSIGGTENCRTDLAWYNAGGALLSTSQGAQVTDTTTGWTPSVGSAIAPAGAAFATAVGNVLSTAAAGEVHYEDEWGIAPGSLGYELVVASDTPVGYWKLGNPAGTTEADSSGNGNNGTIHGTVTGGQAGPIATYPAALADLFDGSTGYVSASPIASLQTTFSIEAWFKSTATGTVVMLAQTAWFDLYMAAGNLRFEDTAGNGVRTTGTFNDGLWHHVVGTISGGVVAGMAIYVDGASVAVTRSGTWAPSTPGGQSLNIGTYSSGLSQFPGSIDEVAVYNTALSAARVTAHYNAATVAGSYVQGWSRGGLVGSTTVAILRSDGLYVRGATPTTPTSIPSAGQAAAVYDYEAALNKPYTYTAVVSAVVGGSTISSTPSADTAAVTTTSRAAWLVVPGTPASNIQLWISKFDATTRSVSQGVTAGIGNPTEFITSDVYRKRHGKLTLSTLDMATRDALQTVLLNGKVLLLQRPSPDPNPAIAGMQLYFLPVGDLTEDKFSSHANTRERTLSVAVVEQPVP